jgi:hypothetical protein
MIKTSMAILTKIVNYFVSIKNQLTKWLEMKQIRRLEIGREKWKNKATLRSEEIREARKAKIRYKERIRVLKFENKQLKEELKKKSQYLKMQ